MFGWERATNRSRFDKQAFLHPAHLAGPRINVNDLSSVKQYKAEFLHIKNPWNGKIWQPRSKS